MGIGSRIARLFRGPQPARRQFAAAQLNRLTDSWRATQEKINDELRNDLDALRARARGLEHNNDYAAHYLEMVETNIIGDSPPRLVSTVENAPGKSDEGARAAIEAAWEDWGRAGVCEVSGKYSWLELCWAIVRGTARDGEFVLRPLRGSAAGNAYHYALQVIDVDRLATWMHRDPQPGINGIAAGVERDAYGRAVAYHFATSDRNSRQVERVGAAEVLHKFIIRRADQARGIPWMSSAMLSMHYAGEFALSALIAAKHGADHIGFFTTPEGEPALVGDEQKDGSQIVTSAPGTFDTLPAGADFKQIDSKYPNEVFGPFIKSANQRMAAGLPGASYPELCNDYEAVNFSSIRAAVLASRDQWRKMHRWFALAWLEPIFADWLRFALANGAIRLANGSPLPIAKADKFKAHQWQFRGWSWVDPLKDAQAARQALNLKLTSRSRLAAEAGRDFEEVLAEHARDEAAAARWRINLTTPDKPAPEPDAGEPQ